MNKNKITGIKMLFDALILSIEKCKSFKSNGNPTEIPTEVV